METIQVRMEIPKKTSASVAYISQSLGIPKQKAYALIVGLFLFERDLDKAIRGLKIYQQTSGAHGVAADPLPFEE